MSEIVQTKDIVEAVTSKIQTMIRRGDLDLPADYSASNALKSAWLILQQTQTKDRKPVLQACTRESIANSLLDMVVQGLNPGKDQCAFIPYGTEMVCQREYHGTLAVLKRVYPGAQEHAQVIHKGDELKTRIVLGRTEIAEHVQKWPPDPEIIGAYAVITFPDRPPYTEIMTIDQIRQAWKQGKVYSGPTGDSFHNRFPDQAVKKTVINRACKLLINSSGDHYLVEAAKRSEARIAAAEVDAEEAELANRKEINVTPPSEPPEPETATRTNGEDEDPPSQRFVDFCEAYDLDIKQARKVLADLHQLGDARKLTNEHYFMALERGEWFLAMYSRKTDGADEHPAGF